MHKSYEISDFVGESRQTENERYIEKVPAATAFL
jgi:hypothetical protein